MNAANSKVYHSKWRMESWERDARDAGPAVSGAAR